MIIWYKPCLLYTSQLEERKTTGFKIGLALNTKQKGGIYNYDKFNPNTEWYYQSNITPQIMCFSHLRICKSNYEIWT